MTDTDDELRRLTRSMFNPPELKLEPEAAATQVVNSLTPDDGSNPATELTADDHGRDFARRLFSDDYTATATQLTDKD